MGLVEKILSQEPVSSKLGSYNKPQGANSMTHEEILRSLLDFANAADLEEVVWEKGLQRVAFKRGFAPASAQEVPVELIPVEPSNKTSIVLSPMVGTFSRALAKDRPPLVMEGDSVIVGQKIGVVMAMKIPQDVIAKAAGRITRVYVHNGDPVEYGQKLFEITAD